MLLFIFILASITSTALSSLVNICVQEPFKQMQGFRDYRPAMDDCATHYPVQTFTKTLPDRCLTSTKTVILGTSTIPAIKNLPCPTNEIELKGREANVQNIAQPHRRGEELLDDKQGGRPTPFAVLKRDNIATKSDEWSSYFSTLVQSGYNYIQTACSCVASPKVELVCFY